MKHYEDVVDETGHGDLASVQDFYRLFVMPGVGHCTGVTDIGPDNIGGENQSAVSPDPQHDIVSALEQWVEHGVAPSKLIATQYNNPNDPTQGIERQRPICPYPAQAVYKGSGSINDASNFTCAARAGGEGNDGDDSEREGGGD